MSNHPQLFDNLSIYITKQNYIIFIYLKEYLAFVKKNYISMNDLIHIGDNLKNSFHKSLKNLKSKKEDLIRKPETIQKWELDPKDNINKNDLLKNKNLALEKMLYKETNNVNNQKQMYGFYLNRILTENERMKNINAERHLKDTLKVIEKETDLIADFLTCLADNNMVLTKKEGENPKRKETKLKNEEEENLDLEVQNEENKIKNNQNTGQ